MQGNNRKCSTTLQCVRKNSRNVIASLLGKCNERENFTSHALFYCQYYVEKTVNLKIRILFKGFGDPTILCQYKGKISKRSNRRYGFLHIPMLPTTTFGIRFLFIAVRSGLFLYSHSVFDVSVGNVKQQRIRISVRKPGERIIERVAA